MYICHKFESVKSHTYIQDINYQLSELYNLETLAKEKLKFLNYNEGRGIAMSTCSKQSKRFTDTLSNVNYEYIQHLKSSKKIESISNLIVYMLDNHRSSNYEN